MVNVRKLLEIMPIPLQYLPVMARGWYNLHLDSRSASIFGGISESTAKPFDFYLYIALCGDYHPGCI